MDAYGRIQVPVRFIAEALGVKVSSGMDFQTRKDVVVFDVPKTAADAPSTRYDLSNPKYTVMFFVRENYFTIHESGFEYKYEMDTKTMNLGGRVYTPVRYVAESLGASLKWYSATNTVEITSGNTVPLFDFEHPHGSADKEPVPYFTEIAPFAIPQNSDIKYKKYDNDPEKDFSIYVDLSKYPYDQQSNALSTILSSLISTDIAKKVDGDIREIVKGTYVGSSAYYTLDGQPQKALEERRFPGTLWSARPIVEIIFYKQVPDDFNIQI
jgi:hypothetical protein